MSLPVAPFQPIEVVIAKLRSLGCEIRKLDNFTTVVYGEKKEIEYAFNPKNEAFYYLDYEDNELVSPDCIENIERTLQVNLGFPKMPQYDEAVISKSLH